MHDRSQPINTNVHEVFNRVNDVFLELGGIELVSSNLGFDVNLGLVTPTLLQVRNEVLEGRHETLIKVRQITNANTDSI